MYFFKNLPGMLTIRNEQLRTLGGNAREQFLENMISHVHCHFPTTVRSMMPDELRCRVIETVERAAAYQLASQQQLCRFINVAATYGWEFDGDPSLPWMRAMLTDVSVTEPGDRLDRLVEACLHRERIREHNRALRRQLESLDGASGP